MGNSPPTNKTGRKVVQKKLENAKKTNILSLQEHKLEEIPALVFQVTKLRTLDISSNKLTTLGSQLSVLKELKSLNCDNNRLVPGSLEPVAVLNKLQTLAAGSNQLGQQQQGPPPPVSPLTSFPKLPTSLKQLKLDANSFSSIPPSICAPGHLTKLDKLDFSSNNLASVPEEISNLVSLTELNLDSNVIVSLPRSVGLLKKLKTLSLKNNHIRHKTASKVNSDKNPQPLPPGLFQDTLLVDLNLHGNPMTSTELNEFEGYDAFLQRRESIKTKNIYGGALTDLDVCGLK